MLSDDRFGYFIGDPQNLIVVYEDDATVRKWAEEQGYSIKFAGSPPKWLRDAKTPEVYGYTR